MGHIEYKPQDGGKILKGSPEDMPQIMELEQRQTDDETLEKLRDDLKKLRGEPVIEEKNTTETQIPEKKVDVASTAAETVMEQKETPPPPEIKLADLPHQQVPVKDALPVPDKPVPVGTQADATAESTKSFAKGDTVKVVLKDRHKGRLGTLINFSRSQSKWKVAFIPVTGETKHFSESQIERVKEEKGTKPDKPHGKKKKRNG